MLHKRVTFLGLLLTVGLIVALVVALGGCTSANETSTTTEQSSTTAPGETVTTTPAVTGTTTAPTGTTTARRRGRDHQYSRHRRVRRARVGQLQDLHAVPQRFQRFPGHQ